MKGSLEILKADSLKDLFVKKLEELIISGRLSIGEHLPPEREIAARMGISRTIVHSGLIELMTKGLITIHPRKGTVVNDYRIDGTLAILNSLVNYNEGEVSPELFDSLMAIRYLLEVECARLAALNRTEADLEYLKGILEKEASVDMKDINTIIALDFNFHHRISISAGNIIYPLIIKSFELIYKNLTSRFFNKTSEIAAVFDFHKKLTKAIESKSSGEAAAVMRRTLEHGEKCLRDILKTMSSH